MSPSLPFKFTVAPGSGSESEELELGVSGWSFSNSGVGDCFCASDSHVEHPLCCDLDNISLERFREIDSVVPL